MENSTERAYVQEHLMAVFKKFMEEIDQEVRVIQLRPKLVADLESNFQGDFDYIINKSDFTPILGLIYERCKNAGINFVLDQKSLNKKRFKFFVGGSDDFCLIIEFWTSVEFTVNKVKKTLPCSAVFETIDNGKLTKNEILALLYITHLFHKKKNIFSAENQFRMKVFLQKLTKEDHLDRDINLSRILKDIRSRTLTLTEANGLALKLLKDAGLKSLNPVWRYKLFLRKAWGKIFHLRRIIPVIGPDGVGKGSIAEGALLSLEDWISFRFKKLYRMPIPYKLRLSLIPDWQSQPKNKLDEKIGYYIFFVVSCMIRALPIAKWGRRVLMDRYFIDYYAAPIRYVTPKRKPQKLKGYRFLLFLTPTPDNMVFMGCRNSSLNDRKNELNEESVAFLQQLYCDFIGRKRAPKVLFLSTENPIDRTTSLLKDFLTTIEPENHRE